MSQLSHVFMGAGLLRRLRSSSSRADAADRGLQCSSVERGGSRLDRRAALFPDAIVERDPIGCGTSQVTPTEPRLLAALRRLISTA